jgi:hypothetical protein
MTVKRKITTEIADPSEVEPSVYQQQVIQKDYHQVVNLFNQNGGEDTFAICRPLNPLQECICKSAAIADTKKQLGMDIPKKDDASYDVWKEIYDTNYKCHVIYQSYRMPDNMKELLFISKENVQVEYTARVIDYMYGNYLLTENLQFKQFSFDLSDPNWMSKVLDKIINQATVEATTFFINGCISQEIALLIRSMGVELIRLRQLNGGAGTPSNDMNENSNTPN